MGNLVIDRYEVAGEFYKTDPPYKHIIAEGAVVNNHIAKVIGNMVLKFNKPKVPFEFFIQC